MARLFDCLIDIAILPAASAAELPIWRYIMYIVPAARATLAHMLPYDKRQRPGRGPTTDRMSRAEDRQERVQLASCTGLYKRRDGSRCAGGENRYARLLCARLELLTSSKARPATVGTYASKPSASRMAATWAGRLPSPHRPSISLACRRAGTTTSAGSRASATLIALTCAAKLPIGAEGACAPSAAPAVA
eukprot:4288473-Prymnesium_polylepis.1